ncbi:MAG: hypothetical protein JXQ82_07955, partial [Methanomicrobiaceae archaeon]|nr:hypothetical protein [Methanomicrobiaceae archaeon]
MQDARLRLFSIILLSASAFFSLTCAGLVFFWWLLFTGRQKSLPPIKIFLGVLLLTFILAIFMQIRGLLGISYFVKMAVILLIAGWAYTEISQNDLLNTMTWLFGYKSGFEMGLISGIALNRIKLISEDYDRTKTAFNMKNSTFRWRDFIPVIGNIFIWSLRDSTEQSKILALRGYKKGGCMYPSFRKSKKDIAPAFFSIFIFLFSFFDLVTY